MENKHSTTQVPSDIMDDIREIKKDLKDFLNRFEDTRDEVITHRSELKALKEFNDKQERINDAFKKADADNLNAIQSIKVDNAKNTTILGTILSFITILVNVLIKLFIK